LDFSFEDNEYKSMLRQEAKQWIEYLTQPESPEENIWIADWIKKYFFNLEVK
jgi:hypothetical protein